MDMNMCDAGEITDAEIAHYVARAAGGTGMLITGSGAVGFPVGATSHRQPGLSDDRFIAGLSRLTGAVHAAEWLRDKSGPFTLDDMIDDILERSHARRER